MDWQHVTCQSSPLARDHRTINCRSTECSKRGYKEPSPLQTGKARSQSLTFTNTQISQLIHQYQITYSPGLSKQPDYEGGGDREDKVGWLLLTLEKVSSVSFMKFKKKTRKPIWARGKDSQMDGTVSSSLQFCSWFFCISAGHTQAIVHENPSTNTQLPGLN